MSKSKGNVVDPDEILKLYGADTARFFILSDSPPDADFDWKDTAVEGCFKFLQKVWRTVVEKEQAINISLPLPAYDAMQGADRELYQLTNRTIQGIERDIQNGFQFNTIISKTREFVNALAKFEPGNEPNAVFSHAIKQLLGLMSPITVHQAETLWERLGGEGSIHDQPWPTYDENALMSDQIEVVLQVNGKVRERVQVAPDTPKDVLEAQARVSDNLKPYLDGKTKNTIENKVSFKLKKDTSGS